MGPAGAGVSLLRPYTTLLDVLSPVINILGASETGHLRSIFNCLGIMPALGLYQKFGNVAVCKLLYRHLPLAALFPERALASAVGRTRREGQQSQF